MSDFKLTVEQITEKPECHRFEVSADWWSAREAQGSRAPVPVEAPFRFDCEAARIREDILLEGDFDGRVGLECSRCAKRYSHALHDSFRLVLSPARERSPHVQNHVEGRAEHRTEAGSITVDPEDERGLAENGLCLGEDLETGWFRGPVIQLDDLFGEVIALAMPLQPLCHEECPGLCPHCGVDRAETQCDCEDEKIESPFAILAKLKGGDD